MHWRKINGSWTIYHAHPVQTSYLGGYGKIFLLNMCDQLIDMHK